MEEEKPKSNKTTLIVVITVIITLIVIGLILGVWFGVRYFQNRIDELEKDSSSPTSTQSESTAETKPAIPSETPAVAAENFIKSIFDTFPGSSVNLATANKYLSSALKSQVNSTKESYWDLHGYIHSGPCSVAVTEISNTGTTAVEEITTEWGESCIGLAEPYYRYHLSAVNGQWEITQIEQLKPSDGEQVPRDF